MDRGNNSEDKSGTQKRSDGDGDPTQRLDEQKQHKEDGRHLRESIRFAEDARPKIAEPGNHEEYSANQQDRDIAAEYHDCVFPGDHFFDRKNQKHGAHQQFVGNGVEILTEHRLLMQDASE